MPTYSDIPGVEIFGTNAGLVTLPCGYLDESGTLHKVLHLRELDGYAEDILDNEAVPVNERTSLVLSMCATKLGAIRDKQIIQNAISGNVSKSCLPLTTLDRTVAMLELRRISLGGRYKFDKSCYACKSVIANKTLDLRTLEITPPTDDRLRKVLATLPSGNKAIIKAITAKEEQDIENLDHSYDCKTVAILARLEAYNGEAVKIDKSGIDLVKKMRAQDRKYIMQTYALVEGSLDTEIQVTCKNSECKLDFEFPLDLGQNYFLQPGKEVKYGSFALTKGPRFFSFLPLGNRAKIEHDCICLAEAYQWDPDVVMKLPVSRRHRFIKLREMIIDSRNGVHTSLDTVKVPEEMQSRTQGSQGVNTGLGYQSIQVKN
jgi:hypothetical protein